MDEKQLADTVCMVCGEILIDVPLSTNICQDCFEKYVRVQAAGEMEVEELTIAEQIEIMEAQINSPEADFTLAEKMAYMVQYFDSDPIFSKEACDVVRANLAQVLAAGEVG